jgi:alpha-L-arabinofuranosidase
MAIAIIAKASQFYVSPFGNNSNNGSKEQAWATIAFAVLQVSNGDTIILDAGTYTESSIVIDKNITIQGLGAKYTIIQSLESEPTAEALGETVFEIQADAEIKGVSIRFSSRAISILAEGNLTISESNILNNFHTVSGAAIYAAGNLTMEKCCVANNTSTASGAGISSSLNTVITNSTISQNQSTDAESMGGGIFISGGTLELKNSTVVYNSAGTKGKGIHVNNASVLVKVFSNNIIAANGAPDVGSNTKDCFPATSDIDYNVISMAFDGYINFGDNTVFNSLNEEAAINTFVDAIALQALADAGNGVLAHAINQNSSSVLNKGGGSETTTDVRNAPRTNPDIGAYEYVENAPMTSLSILNTQKSIPVNKAVPIAVSAFPAYTTENYTLSINPVSEADALLNDGILTATTLGKVIVDAVNNSNPAINSSIELSVIEEVQIQVASVSISMLDEYKAVLTGNTLSLEAIVLPNEAVNKTVTWSVSPSEFASISQEGILTAIKPGTVTVSLTSDENALISDQVEINIIDSTPLSMTIDASSILKTGIINPSGAVLCWLTDSDIERPRTRTMETALREMKAGSLRFPYGALSNNYLWTKDLQNIPDKLEPSVAVPDNTPGNWDWAVDEQTYFKKDMDFDEYVALCREIGAEPVVCVNIMSHVYSNTDDITIDTLIDYAKDWVRYANITKAYNIKYWQLGNEQDHHSDIYPLDDFKVDYKNMATAMREVDPDIMIAPGLLQNWVGDMISYCPEQIDFMTCHQYLWFGGSETEGYSAWKDYGVNIIPNITKRYNTIKNSSKPNLEMFLTETGVTGGKYPDSDVFNLYKGLILFEMQMEEIQIPNVKYTFYWGTHSPWDGEFGDPNLSTLFSNNDANENHLQADILTAINTHIQPKYAGRKTTDGTVTYTTISQNDSLMVLFILNKNAEPRNISVAPENISGLQKLEKWTLAGKNEFDNNVKFQYVGEDEIINNTIETELPPLSITILHLSNPNFNNNKIYPTDERMGNLKIFPNPAKDKLNIKYQGEFSKNAKLTITNISGQIVKSEQLPNDLSINISALQEGVYILNIIDGQNIHKSFFIHQ